MHLKKRFVIVFTCIVLLLLIFLYTFSKTVYINEVSKAAVHFKPTVNFTNAIPVNVWLTFTRLKRNPSLKRKFQTAVLSLLSRASVPVNLNVFVDANSSDVAANILENLPQFQFTYALYKLEDVVETIEDIVRSMMGFFSSGPDSYYNDALFFLSFGLYRIAPKSHDYAIMIDCDVKFTSDISLLFAEFNKFHEQTLFALSYELSPVYRHVLTLYRAKNPLTSFGSYIGEVHSNTTHKYGFPGFNSGVILMDLRKIRESFTYEKLISKENIERIVMKYQFKGHLGDQDYYTLLGFEYGDLIHTLSCVFNRQLCTWWRNHGYEDVFRFYFRCDGVVRIYHGNCNTHINTFL